MSLARSLGLKKPLLAAAAVSPLAALAAYLAMQKKQEGDTGELLPEPHRKPERISRDDLGRDARYVTTPGMDHKAADTAKPLYRDTVTFRDAVAPFYATTPGGFDAAAAAAQAAMRRRADNEFARWTPEALERAVETLWVANSPFEEDSTQASLDGIDAQAITRQNRRSEDRVIVGGVGEFPWDEPDAQASLRHELLHAAMHKNAPRESKTPIIPWQLARRFVPAIAWKDYLEQDWDRDTATPVELDPALAEIKRRYAKDTGILVDTIEKAGDAWERYGESGPYQEPLRDTLPFGYFKILDAQPEEIKQKLLRRMLELVQAQNSQRSVA